MQHTRRSLQVHALFFILAFLCSMLLNSCNLSSGNVPTATHGPAHPTPTPLATEDTGTGNAASISPVATTGCAKPSPIRPGTSQDQTVAAHPEVARGFHTRTYRVHVPAIYTGKTPLPVVLIFHGHGGTAQGTERGTAFSQVSESAHFLAVYPQGLEDDDHLPMWASIGPIDYNIDETVFMKDMLNKLEADFCIDARRVYATGFSNGGGMSGFVACKLSNRIAAVAPMAGNYYALQGGCQPTRPVPVLEIHGLNDPVVPYDGISAEVNPDWPLPSVQAWLETWAQRNGCTRGPQTFFQDSEATGIQWIDCHEHATVMHYRMIGGGHSMPDRIGNQLTEQVTWNFFKDHPMLEKPLHV